jgi:hypothetical protein
VGQRSIPLLKKEGEGKGYEGAQAEEYAERQFRLDFLKKEMSKALMAHRDVCAILDEYDALLPKFPEKEPGNVWGIAIAKFFSSLPGGVQPDPSDLELMPMGISTRKPPKDISTLKQLSRMEWIFAAYRKEISEALTQLPMDRKIGEHPERLTTVTIAKANTLFWSQVADGKVFEGIVENQLEKAGADDVTRAAIEKRVEEAAQNLLQNPRLPRASRQALMAQMDFMKKYSISPPAMFMAYLITYRKLLESP